MLQVRNLLRSYSRMRSIGYSPRDVENYARIEPCSIICPSLIIGDVFGTPKVSLLDQIMYI
jgi:hypothetical protein